MKKHNKQTKFLIFKLKTDDPVKIKEFMAAYEKAVKTELIIPDKGYSRVYVPDTKYLSRMKLLKAWALGTAISIIVVFGLYFLALALHII